MSKDIVETAGHLLSKIFWVDDYEWRDSFEPRDLLAEPLSNYDEDEALRLILAALKTATWKTVVDEGDDSKCFKMVCAIEDGNGRDVQRSWWFYSSPDRDKAVRRHMARAKKVVAERIKDIEYYLAVETFGNAKAKAWASHEEDVDDSIALTETHRFDRARARLVDLLTRTNFFTSNLQTESDLRIWVGPENHERHQISWMDIEYLSSRSPKEAYRLSLILPPCAGLNFSILDHTPLGVANFVIELWMRLGFSAEDLNKGLLDLKINKENNND